MQKPKYKRVLIKLSGEALNGGGTNIFDLKIVENVIQQIKQLVKLKVQVAIVIGGGNIFRGLNAEKFGLQKANADYMGILATVINGIALKDFFIHAGIDTSLYSAIKIGEIVHGYNRDQVINDLNQNKVIILTAGVGSPFFTTDSGAALRAIEIDADLLIKATKVDGVYDLDPKKSTKAKKYQNLTFKEAINKNLKIMDISAFDLCHQHKINILVCDLFCVNSLQDAVAGKPTGTIIHI